MRGASRDQQTTMYSWTSRLNAIFTFAVTVLGVLAALNCFSVQFRNGDPIVHSLKLTELQRPKNFQYQSKAAANVKFDLDVDFSNTWNWNVKLLFVYVTAEYQTEQNVVNQVVIWDHMLKSPEETHLKHFGQDAIPVRHAHGEPFFFPLVDQSVGMWGKDVTLSISWCVMPVVGNVKRYNQTVAPFKFPTSFQDSKRFNTY